MTYDFETRVDREGTGSLKAMFTPEALVRAGLPTYWGAEFEFPTCPAFSEGVRKCAERGLYGFTVQDGAYNDAVCWWMENVRGFHAAPDWIVPTQGTIFALATAIRLFLAPQRKRLIVLSPGYNRYAQAADRMGLETVYSHMRLEEGVYRPDFADLEKKMSDPRCGLLVFSNPNNPTGRVLTAEELSRIGALSERYGMPVFCDEIFAEVVREGRVTPYIACGRGRALAMICTSLGKCMSLTGVNHANLLIPDADLRERYARQKYADHYGSIDPMLYAGLVNACGPAGADFIRALNGVINENCARMESALPSLVPGAAVIHPQGAYVIWVDYRAVGPDADEIYRHLERDCLFCGDLGDDYQSDRRFCRYNLAVPPRLLDRSLDILRERW